MKNYLFVLACCIALTSEPGYTEWVNGYVQSDGTYVQGHYRSNRNSTVRDNYNYKGNINPYTGEEGHNYYRDNRTSEYYNPYSIQAPTFYQAPVQRQSIKCYSCDGLGYVVCSTCRGTGDGLTCFGCQGNGYTQLGKCFSCKGRGSGLCFSCKGTGVKTCMYCSGTGYK